jgi:hypothetical protein
MVLGMSLVEEFREWVKKRPKVLRVSKGSMGQIGTGVVVEQFLATFEDFVRTVQEKRPKVIPTVMQKIKEFQPGKALMGLAPTSGTTARTPARTPETTPERGLLRKPK